MLRNKNTVGNYYWPRISKIYFKGRYFMLRVTDKNVSRPLETLRVSLFNSPLFIFRTTKARTGLKPLRRRHANIYGNAAWNITPFSASCRFHPQPQIYSRSVLDLDTGNKQNSFTRLCSELLCEYFLRLPLTNLCVFYGSHAMKNNSFNFLFKAVERRTRLSGMLK